MATTSLMYIADFANPSIQVALRYVPVDITKGRTANFAEVAIAGRSNPLLHYLDGKDTLSMTVMDHRDSDPFYVKRFEDNLQAFAYGSRVLVFIGNYIRDKVYVLNSVTVKPADLRRGNEFLPDRTEINLSFTLDPVRSVLPADLRSGNNTIQSNNKLNFEAPPRNQFVRR